MDKITDRDKLDLIRIKGINKQKVLMANSILQCILFDLNTTFLPEYFSEVDGKRHLIKYWLDYMDIESLTDKKYIVFDDIFTYHYYSNNSENRLEHTSSVINNMFDIDQLISEDNIMSLINVTDYILKYGKIYRKSTTNT